MKKFYLSILAIVMAVTAVASTQVTPSAKKVAVDPNNYEFKTHKTVKVPKFKVAADTTKIVCTNLDVDDSMLEMYLAYMEFGFVSVYGSDGADWEVLADLYTTDENYLIEYTGEDAEISLVYQEKDTIELAVSEAEMKNTEKGLVFTAIGADESSKVYSIHMTLVVPEHANDTVAIKFDKAAEVSYYGETGDYYIFAANDKYVATFDFYTDKRFGVGEYGAADFDKSYTNLYKINGTDTVSLGGYYTASLKIAEAKDGRYDMAAEFFAKGDTVLYQISMFYQKPVAKDTIDVNLDNAQLGDYIENNGLFQIIAAPADSAYGISLTPLAEKLEGTFTELDLYGQYSYIWEGEETYDIVEAEFTTKQEGKVVTATGTLLASNEKFYKFVIKANIQEQAIENVNIEAVESKKMIQNGQLIIIKDGVKYNAQGAILAE